MDQDTIVEYMRATCPGVNIARPDDGPGAGDTFRRLFEAPDEFDYAALDRLMPHPVYASQSWVCVLNPSVETFESIKPLLAEAYSSAVARLGRRRGE